MNKYKESNQKFLLQKEEADAVYLELAIMKKLLENLGSKLLKEIKLFYF